MPDPILIYNRSTGKMEQEIILGDKLLRLAYSTPMRHVLSWPLFGTALFSRLLGKYADSSLSRKRIDRTIQSLKIDISQYLVPQGGFTCFNDFFARKLQEGARPFATDGFASPADSRLLLYPHLTETTCFPVKGASFTLEELFGTPGREFVQDFLGGALCIFRLCPSDYHRYHFMDDGTLLKHWRLPGRYHSVSPLALEQNIRVFTTNVREISLLDCAHLGRCAFIEVGAFGVASIQQTHTDSCFKRGDEKGYFTFGGSTIIVILQKEAVRFDTDILEKSAEHTETLVQAGMHLGDVNQEKRS